MGTLSEDLIYFLEMHLSSDVAGATLMAAALSSPDLFVNLVGTFVTEGDIGIGTVVGCGVFNSLALPALCIFLSPAKVCSFILKNSINF